jgi:DNA-binding NtrC family response regulator
MEEEQIQERNRMVLVVEDESLFAISVCKRLRRAGYDCEIAGTLAEALRHVTDQGPPDLMLLDMRLPDGSGLDLLEKLRADTTSEIPVVVLTAYGEVEDAVAAMKLKALDYLKKPIDLDELLLTVERVVNEIELRKRLDYSLQRESHAMEAVRLIGESAPMIDVKAQIERIAQLSSRAQESPPTVLILGETGVGKDLAARLLHLKSSRYEQPFVHVDCATLPKDLIEAELFGHEKGAFTSATTVRNGLIEAAEHGTVFLDEIAELPLDLQSKLLAMLERRRTRRIGSRREQPVMAWFIAGTNRPLEAMVKQGEFRADLYYRLKVLTLMMPALRERNGDIELLARHFAAGTSQRFGLTEPRLTEDALLALRRYSWPGNVRELAHMMERAVLLCGGEELTASTLMIEPPAVESNDEPRAEVQGMTLDEAESALIRQALQQTGGNVSEAARQLGITRMTLRYRMQKYGISTSK